MQVNIETVKKRFEKNMDKYDGNAVVQMHTAHKLINAICRYGNEFDKILELGTGTGILTRETAAHINYKTYYANDLIEKSKEYLDKILPRYTFISGNAQDIQLPERMNLILSNALFQWFKNIDFLHLADMLEKDGLLAFTTFSPENFREIREITGLSLEYKSVDEIKNAMSLCFEILHIEEYTEVLHFTTVLELLAHMKNTGVNNLLSHNLTFKEVKDFCADYERKFTYISLTYSPIIVIGEKI